MSQVETPEPEVLKPWEKGTDLRNDEGFYVWPHKYFAADEREYFPSVTSILDLVPGSMPIAKAYFIADYVSQLLELAKAKQTVRCYDKELQTMVERDPREVMADKQWLQWAGDREMTRRANRGTVAHDALEDWALRGVRISPGELHDYTFQLIQANNFALEVDFVIDYVAATIAWCDKHIVEVLWSEAPIFNRTYNYAGTSDIGLRLQGIKKPEGGFYSEDESWGIDLKNSKSPQPTHAMQNAAYANAEFMGIKGTTELVPFPKPDRTANLYVQPNKATLRVWQRDEDAFNAFLYLRMVWQYLESKDKSVIVKPPKMAAPTAEQMAIPGV